MTTVVNIRCQVHVSCSCVTYDIYIGRPGRGQEGFFGNPHHVGQVCGRCKYRHMTAASTLPCFAAYFEGMLRDESFRRRVLELRGKRLGCFCKKRGDEPCHGDVIASWLDGDYAEWRKRWKLA